jgi:hypothetical protein
MLNLSLYLQWIVGSSQAVRVQSDTKPEVSVVIFVENVLCGANKHCQHDGLDNHNADKSEQYQRKEPVQAFQARRRSFNYCSFFVRHYQRSLVWRSTSVRFG